jgi:hypothetical protein
MTIRQSFQPVRLFKTIARPILLPVLRRLGLRQSDLPRVSRRDRVPINKVASRVTVREDQTILLNGAPFFPIGLYYAQDEIADVTGAGLSKLRAMGFNTISFRAETQNTDELDRIWDAGLHVWYRPPGALHTDYHQLKEVVSKFAAHPALLFWEMDDEPVFNEVSFSQVAVGCKIVRSIDPYHPILCNQWMSALDQAEEMIRWARLADVYGFSMYPVPLWRWGKRMSLVESGWPHAISVVGKQTDLWRSYAPGKPIIPVLQAWAWNCLEDAEAAFPTYAESRFMAYQGVIHGAKGLHHYGATQAARLNFACGIPPPRDYENLEKTHADFLEARSRNEQFWSYYSRVINEISRMSGVFASYDSDWVPEIKEMSTTGQIEFRVKRHVGSTVTLMVNASGHHAQFEAHAPELTDQVMKVWGQGRTIKVNSQGRFQDTLGPYGVGVYSDQQDLLEGLSNSTSSGDEYGRIDHAAQEKI